jgi:hypothetical protein
MDTAAWNDVQPVIRVHNHQQACERKLSWICIIVATSKEDEAAKEEIPDGQGGFWQMRKEAERLWPVIREPLIEQLLEEDMDEHWQKRPSRDCGDWLAGSISLSWRWSEFIVFGRHS